MKGWRIAVENPVRLEHGFVPDLQRIAADNVDERTKADRPKTNTELDLNNVLTQTGCLF